MTHLELFSGIGGFRRALDLLSQDGIMPFKCVGYSEIDTKAKQTYKTNFKVDGEVDMEISSLLKKNLNLSNQCPILNY